MQSNGKALCAFLKGDKNDKKTVRRFTLVVDLPCVTLPVVKQLNIPDNGTTDLPQEGIIFTGSGNKKLVESKVSISTALWYVFRQVAILPFLGIVCTGHTAQH